MKALHLSFALLILLQLYLTHTTALYQEAPPIHRCYYPGTEIPPEEPNHSAKRFQISGRWGATATSGSNLVRGQPTTLTWSVVPDGTPIGGFAGESASPSNLRSAFTSSFGSQSAWMNMFYTSFSMWSNVSGITFVYEPNDDGMDMGLWPVGVRGVRGDIRLGGHRIDGNYGVLAYTFGPDNGDMVIDSSDSFFPSNLQWIPNVVAHELGHALGMGHVCPVSNTKLLEPYFSSSFYGPQLDDIRAVQRWYGDKYENNDSPSTATQVGNSDSVISLNTLSLDDSSDVDYFTFTTGANNRVTINLSPFGSPYVVGPVTGNPICSVASDQITVYPSNIYNLKFDLLTSSGALISTISNAGLGQTESSTTVLSANTRYIIKVYTTDGNQGDSVQMYNLQISADTVAISNPSSTPSRSSNPAPSSSQPSLSSSRSAAPSSTQPSLSSSKSRNPAPSSTQPSLSLSRSPAQSSTQPSLSSSRSPAQSSTQPSVSSSMSAAAASSRPPIATSQPTIWTGKVTLYSSSWELVTMSKSFNDMTAVCSMYYSNTQNSMSIRMRNANSGNTFEIQVIGINQLFSGPVDVHCLVVESGVYNYQQHGIKMEAGKFNSATTNHKGNWDSSQNVYYSNAYSSPVVLGQVMTSNDINWSVFYARGPSATEPVSAGSSSFWAGKHVGEDTNTIRQTETIGIIVMEAGIGSLAGRRYEAVRGSDIYGMGNAPPYSVGLSGNVSPNYGLVSAMSNSGPDGGYPVFYGNQGSALQRTNVNVAIDEDQIGDVERFHGNAEVVGIVVIE